MYTSLTFVTWESAKWLVNTHDMFCYLAAWGEPEAQQWDSETAPGDGGRPRDVLQRNTTEVRERQAQAGTGSQVRYSHSSSLQSDLMS